MNNSSAALRFEMDQPSVPSAPADPHPKFLQRFVVKLDSRIFALPVEQVDWIESAANYVRLHSGTNSYLMRGTMASVEKGLDPRQFRRVHRNAIINLSRVQQYHMPARGSMYVVLHDGTRVPLSRGYQAAVRQLLQGPAATKNSLASGPAGHPMS